MKRSWSNSVGRFKGVKHGFIVLLAGAIWLGMFSIDTNAQSTDELIKQMQKQMQAMQKRLNQLEKRNQQLETKMKEQKQQEIPSELKQVEEPIQAKDIKGEKPAVRSNFNMDLYGYVKFDASYDTHRTDNGNFVTWVLPEQTSDDDGAFNATAKQSRFGFNIYGPDMGNMQSAGKFEMDFYGAGGPENKALFRMRKAYLTLDWPEYDLTLLAGQAYDTISPLLPKTANFLVQGRAGNIGYRHPQLRFTKGFNVGNGSRAEFTAGISRTIGDNTPNAAGDTGEDAGFPTIQSRFGYSFPFLSGRDTTIGISGHYGQEEYDFDNADNNENFDTWSVNLDLSLPLTEQLELQGEVYTGENLDDYYGGILQGVNPNPGIMTEVEAIGGWGAFSYTPFKEWNFNAGYSIEDLDDDGLSPNMRAQNQSVFGNVFYQINKATIVGFETSYWDTEYVNLEDGDSLRFQGTLIYKF